MLRLNTFHAKFRVVFHQYNFPSYYQCSQVAHEDGTECSEMSADKIQTPGYYPEESIRHSEQGESLKSRMK
jgi:hypothetical protein